MEAIIRARTRLPKIAICYPCLAASSSHVDFRPDREVGFNVWYLLFNDIASLTVPNATPPEQRQKPGSTIARYV
ncbi:hypothetical protein [Microcoleus sp. herbarium12]|uniref:hypothetical protein n=1 Tax=Microcoleus sp. herbarium12 TaxID=3055437 RepID=UPI002FD3E8CD